MSKGEPSYQTLARVAQVKLLVNPTVPLVQIALRFCLSHPAVTAVIPGVRSAEQAACNLAADEQGALPQELLERIARLWREEFRYNVRTSIGEEGEG